MDEKPDGSVTVEGYAAVFEQETVIAGAFREKIARGAFSDAVGRDDVVFLVNHEGLPLARTRSGTLELRQDEKGLHIRSELDPEDPDVKAILGKMRRGDLDKMSFAFLPEGRDGQEWSEDEDDKLPLRTINRAALYDVSIVTTPAYDGTEIGLRSLQEHRESKEAKENKVSAYTLRKLRMKARQHPAIAQEGGKKQAASQKPTK